MSDDRTLEEKKHPELLDLPPAESKIVPADELHEMLDEQGKALDFDDWYDCRHWDVKEATDKTPVYVNGRYTYQFLTHWEDSWHSKPMIKDLRTIAKWVPRDIDEDNPRVHKMGFTEFKCSWNPSLQLFEQMSGHMQQLLQNKG